jgi:2-polyprenyl-3-methyl-5-hydroxy-6-metoxy-1,4-benzoquinol methylase
MEQPASPTSSWSRAQIDELLRSESFDYQAVPLPYGLSTGGHDRSSTARVILPQDMSGQSFIDVGCSLGYFCFEAKRRGAGRVVGLDFAPENARRGRILSDVLGLDVEFQVGDIDREAIGETFDHVICLNVLHHLANPILALDRLIAITRRQLTLELATFGAHDRRKLGIGWLQEKLLSQTPSLLVGRGTAGEGVKQFYITKSAIENLLRFRKGCFASIEIMPSPFKERFLVIAHKRQIGNLAIVGFPAFPLTAPVVKGVHDLAYQSVSQFLDLKAGTPVLDADRYHEPRQASDDRLIFNYNLLRPFISGAIAFEHDPALDVLQTAEHTRAVTIWMPPDQLIKSLSSQLTGATGKARKKLTHLLGLYQDRKQIIRHYRAWTQYLSQANVDHRILLIGEADARLVTPEEWEREVASPLLA